MSSTYIYFCFTSCAVSVSRCTGFKFRERRGYRQNLSRKSSWWFPSVLCFSHGVSSCWLPAHSRKNTCIRKHTCIRKRTDSRQHTCSRKLPPPLDHAPSISPKLNFGLPANKGTKSKRLWRTYGHCLLLVVLSPFLLEFAIASGSGFAPPRTMFPTISMRRTKACWSLAATIATPWRWMLPLRFAIMAQTRLWEVELSILRTVPPFVINLLIKNKFQSLWTPNQVRIDGQAPLENLKRSSKTSGQMCTRAQG